MFTDKRLQQIISNSNSAKIKHTRILNNTCKRFFSNSIAAHVSHIFIFLSVMPPVTGVKIIILR
jgi:hypothetical protein